MHVQQTLSKLVHLATRVYVSGIQSNSLGPACVLLCVLPPMDVGVLTIKFSTHVHTFSIRVSLLRAVVTPATY